MCDAQRAPIASGTLRCSQWLWVLLADDGQFWRAAQVVIVSPLMRALETASGAFGGGAYKGSGRPLMLAQVGCSNA